MDVFTKDERSEIMRRVKSKENKSTEEKLIDYFHENHITGWCRNYKVKGHPDFIFRRNISQFLSMVASGTVTTAGIPAPLPTPRTGTQNGRRTRGTMQK